MAKLQHQGGVIDKIDQQLDQQQLVDSSSPVNGADGSFSEIAIKDITISDLERSSAWAELKLQEYSEIIAHRKNWSNVLLCLVSLIIIMDFVIMVLVGSNALSFTSSLAIPAFIGSSVLEIFGLSYIVVQYLFPNSKTDAMLDKAPKEK